MGLAAPTSQHRPSDSPIRPEPTHSANNPVFYGYTPLITRHTSDGDQSRQPSEHTTGPLQRADPTTTSPAMADTSATPFPHIRSCEICRQRKVKCDRQQPCSHCARAGQDCVYPAGPGRAPKRSRRAENAQLMDKLSRLEHIIKRLASEDKGDSEGTVDPDTQGDVDHPGTTQHSSRTDAQAKKQQAKSPGEASQVSGENESSLDVQFGRLVINDSQSYYVGNVLWANLANEVRPITPFV